MALAERVLQAYEATGLIPARHAFYGNCGEKKFGCGLTALAFQLHGVTPELYTEWEAYRKMEGHPHYNTKNPVERWAQSLYGKEFSIGFIEGFDGDEYDARIWEDDNFDTNKYQEGYQEGARTWNLLTSHGLTNVAIRTVLEEPVGV